MAATPTEAQQRYTALTERIAALDRDIGRELDGERRLSLQERREDLVRERDGVAAELAASERRTNGDLEALQRKVADLARVLSSDHPAEAHAIITDCIAALGRLDTRVYGLEHGLSDHERRLTVVEAHVTPPRVVTFWRIMALIVLIVGAAFMLSQRVLLLGLYPLFGAVLAGVFVALAGACLLLANAKLAERVK